MLANLQFWQGLGRKVKFVRFSASGGNIADGSRRHRKKWNSIALDAKGLKVAEGCESRERTGGAKRRGRSEALRE